MSYFEFVFSGILTPEYEDKSNELLSDINKYYVPYVIHKIIDEKIDEDKNKRTMIIHSHMNNTDIFYDISTILRKEFVEYCLVGC